MTAFWPSVSKETVSKEEARRARKRKRYADQRDEARRLTHARDVREMAQQAAIASQFEKEGKEKQKQLEDIHAKLHSPDFKNWYEATTDEPVEAFIQDVAISPSEYSARRMGMPQIEWTKIRIEIVLDRNRWTNPELKAEWARRLAGMAPSERRRAMVKLATPRWADDECTMAIYRERDRLTAATGVLHEVDHIYPIISNVVCGLHVHFNLRVIPQADNRSKSNKFPGANIFVD